MDAEWAADGRFVPGVLGQAHTGSGAAIVMRSLGLGASQEGALSLRLGRPHPRTSIVYSRSSALASYTGYRVRVSRRN